MRDTNLYLYMGFFSESQINHATDELIGRFNLINSEDNGGSARVVVSRAAGPRVMYRFLTSCSLICHILQVQGVTNSAS